MAPFGLWILGMKWAGYVQGSRAATGPEVSGPFRSGGGVGPDLGLRVGRSALFLGWRDPANTFFRAIHQRLWDVLVQFTRRTKRVLHRGSKALEIAHQ